MNIETLKDLVEYAEQATLEGDPLPGFVLEAKAYIKAKETPPLVSHVNKLPLVDALWFFIENVNENLPECEEIFRRLRERMREEPRLFMVTCNEEGSGTDYIAVLARNEDEAVEIVFNDNPERQNIDTTEGSFNETLLEQYGGIAVLSTGM
jgi:hypothetical protein